MSKIKLDRHEFYLLKLGEDYEVVMSDLREVLIKHDYSLPAAKLILKELSENLDLFAEII